MTTTINAATSGGLISTADTSGVLALQTAGTTAVTVDASQNVGIGTSSPAVKLEVSGGTSPAIARLSTTNNQGGGAAPYNFGELQFFSSDAETPQVLAYVNAVADTASTLPGSILAFGTSAAGSGTAKVAERMRLDSSGNLGLGVTPSAWGSAYRTAMQVGAGACFAGTSGSSASDYFAIGGNFYLNSSASYRYITTATANRLEASAGEFRFYNAPSGTAGNAITFTQAMTLDASGRLGVGTTSPLRTLTSGGTSGELVLLGTGADGVEDALIGRISSQTRTYGSASTSSFASIEFRTGGFPWYSSGIIAFLTANGDGTTGAGAERARIDGSGNLLVGKASTSFSTNGMNFTAGGLAELVATSSTVIAVNRLSTDGNLIDFYQAGTQEGNISVSGTTVSYNGGHLARYAQTTTAKDDSILKGTVLSNLDEMNVYTKDGQPVANEQLNKVKVSDTEGDVNVAGVFVNWAHDDAHDVDEINMAMTGDMIIRIAQGVTVVRGDLLMSAGDGTAKPQGDDIIRSKTVAKVTSNYVTCTYADGSYCVPCVLMAC